MKTKLVVAAAILVLAASCKTKDANQPDSGTVKISGTIAGLDTGYLEMILPSNEEPKVDSIKIEKGKFSHKFEVKEPELVMMRIAGLQAGELAFFADPGTVTITANKDSLWSSKVDGGTNQKLLKEAEVKIKGFMQKGQDLYPAYQEALGKQDTATLKRIEVDLIALQEQSKTYALDFARKNRQTAVAAYLSLVYLGPPGNEKELKAMYDTLAPSARQTFFGRKMNEQLTAAANTSVGAMAPDFTLNDPEGKPVPLSSLRGKYVLIDFWASWCKPCRAENPNVVAAYNQYKDKNFTILGVSLDEDRQAWVEAIAADKLAWNQVSDLAQWNSAAARLYKVSSIPANFLLDPSGKIIARDLRGDALAAALASYLQ